MKIKKTGGFTKIVKNDRATVIADNVKSFNKIIDSKATQFIDDAQPTKVTWYNIDQERSMKGKGFKDTSGHYDGGIKYKIIHNYIVYGYTDTRGVDVQEGENVDIHFNVEDLQFIHLPNTLLPFVDDKVSLEYENHEYLYTVTESVPVTFNNKSYIRTTVKKDTIKSYGYYEKDFIKDGLITDIFEYVPDNIGTKYKPFLRSEDIDYIDTLKEYKKELNDQFNDYFYDEHRNIYTIPDNSHHNGYLAYTPLIVDLQMEFRTLWTFGVNTILHHETLINRRSKHNYRRNIVRQFLNQSKNSWGQLKEEGIPFSGYLYSKHMFAPCYKIESYLNEGKEYWVYDYYHGTNIFIDDNGNQLGYSFNKEVLRVPEKLHKLFEQYFTNKIDKGYILEFLEDYDFDLTFCNMIMTFIIMTILDKVIHDLQSKNSDRGGLFVDKP